MRGYQMERVRVWLDPWSDRLGDGFHTVQGLLALGVGGLFGTGLGESRVFVPNAFNDFIFAEIGQEFGFLGAAVVIGLFVVLAYAGVRTALAAPDTFGALLAAGITGWLCLQALINIGVVVTIFPITGITLPFISAGGSSLIISFAAVGILLSISAGDRSEGDMEYRCGSLIAGGGTGGHIYPALAVARSLRARPDAPELAWLGGHRGLEASLVPPTGIPFSAAGPAFAAHDRGRHARRDRPAPPRRCPCRRRRRSSRPSVRPRSSRPAATWRSRC